ncbi:hypothetical protein D3C87_2028070 [compost metagenome]
MSRSELRLSRMALQTRSWLACGTGRRTPSSSLTQPSSVVGFGVGTFVSLTMVGGDHRQQYLCPEGVKLAFRLNWL